MLYSYYTSTSMSKRYLFQTLWQLHGKTEVCPSFLVLLKVYIKVINVSVTHPWILHIKHPT
jgi:hypothetical protein